VKERQKERRIDETLVNLIKTKHPAKGEREDKERGPKTKPKAHKPKEGSQGGKGTNYVYELPPVARSIYQRKKGNGKLESVVSLEEPSLGMQ
jgi:hypothetical protein